MDLAALLQQASTDDCGVSVSGEAGARSAGDGGSGSVWYSGRNQRAVGVLRGHATGARPSRARRSSSAILTETVTDEWRRKSAIPVKRLETDIKLPGRKGSKPKWRV